MPSVRPRNARVAEARSRIESQVAQRKVAEMVARLQRYHALGRQVNSSDPSTSELAATLAAVSVSTMQKARAFARQYTEAELASLCRLRRPQGLPLHWGYIPYLLTIQDKRTRSEFERRAAKQGWTAPELYGAIRRELRPEPLRAGGRPRKLPKLASRGLEQLIHDSRLWRERWADLSRKLRPKDQRLRAQAIAELEATAEIAVRLAGELKERSEV